jgi:hypothetical protein
MMNYEVVISSTSTFDVPTSTSTFGVHYSVFKSPSSPPEG